MLRGRKDADSEAAEVLAEAFGMTRGELTHQLLRGEGGSPWPDGNAVRGNERGLRMASGRAVEHEGDERPFWRGSEPVRARFHQSRARISPTSPTQRQNGDRPLIFRS